MPAKRGLKFKVIQWKQKQPPTSLVMTISGWQERCPYSYDGLANELWPALGRESSAWFKPWRMLFLHDLAFPSKRNPKTQTQLRENSYNVRLGRCHHSHILMPYNILYTSFLKTLSCRCRSSSTRRRIVPRSQSACSLSSSMSGIMQNHAQVNRTGCRVEHLLRFFGGFHVPPWVTPWLSHQRSPGMELLHSAARWCPPVVEQELGINFCKATMWHKTMNVE